MKLHKYIFTAAIAALTLNSCYDEKMDWGKPDGHGDVAIAEIPLNLAEKLANYDYIKNYAAQYMPNAVIGLGMGASIYLEDADFRQVADENFQMLTTGNAMKHDAVVGNSGTFNWTTIDNFFAAIPADMKVYGHTLLWHTQQRAAYLNSLIKPDVIVEEDGSGVANIVPNSDFEEGNANQFGAWGNSSTKAISEKGEGYKSDYAMVLTNPTDANSYNAQAAFGLDDYLIPGETYVIQFYAKSSSSAGKLQTQYQNSDTYGSQGAYKTFDVGTSWVLCENEFTTEFDDVNRILINFGEVGATYYIDDFKFGLKKENETETVVNLFDNSDFESGDTNPWGSWGGNSPTKAISEKGKGYKSDYAMVLTNPVDGDFWQAQAAYTFDGSYLEMGETYRIEFWAKSDSPAGQLQTQYQNGTSYGSQGAYNTYEIGTEWVLCEYEFEAEYDDINRILINFGKVGANYYIDNIKFGKPVEQTTTPPMLNIFNNSDFEEGNADQFGSWGGNNPTKSVSGKGEGYKSDYAMILTNPVDGDFWQAQAAYTFDNSYLEMGATYMLQFWAKCDTPAGQLQTQHQNSTTYGSQGAYNAYEVGTDWMLYEHEFEMTFDDVDRIIINFGKVAGNYYIDDIKFGKKIETRAAPARMAAPVTRGIITVEKTPEQKKAIITEAMKTWITTMVDHCKERVHMWDVLNEPVADNGTQLRGVDVVPAEVGTNEFYWGQYIGKEYALKAFQFAREADPEAILFINDFNLETSPTKLATLIDYVEWIDKENGTPIVDGIGTQMHLHAPSITREEIDAMFKTMAATGKLVRVTELDVRLEYNPESQIVGTVEQFERQALVYQWVAESYRENVPQAQQSGITIWSLTDHAREHEFWLKNDVPNLFNANYERKHAYKGFCDGLAGRDISEDFNGENWKDAYPVEEEE
ncbi:endo-1,4-beta-xylanase [Bacteroides sp. 519]|uniref:endo-1,4-beta-xylanase n=1 Tax=Bacteroides sp. 519 TaxID=2302937 RepID=UPI0013D4F057|nr:endo-1,4-beta-xylanase [Bacteroides sp. 519]NDV60208.1 hypothetical protein [Bacteroides sp. 519]